MTKAYREKYRFNEKRNWGCSLGSTPASANGSYDSVQEAMRLGEKKQVTRDPRNYAPRHKFRLKGMGNLILKSRQAACRGTRYPSNRSGRYAAAESLSDTLYHRGKKKEKDTSIERKKRKRSLGLCFAPNRGGFVKLENKNPA